MQSTRVFEAGRHTQHKGRREMGIPRIARVPGGDLPASCGLGGNWEGGTVESGLG